METSRDDCWEFIRRICSSGERAMTTPQAAAQTASAVSSIPFPPERVDELRSGRGRVRPVKGEERSRDLSMLAELVPGRPLLCGQRFPDTALGRTAQVAERFRPVRV